MKMNRQALKMKETKPVESRKKKKKASIEITKEWCKGCSICVDFCPKDVLVMKGLLVEVKDLEACTICNLCEALCPDFAIVVKAVEPQSSKEKHHAVEKN